MKRSIDLCWKEASLCVFNKWMKATNMRNMRKKRNYLEIFIFIFILFFRGALRRKSNMKGATTTRV